MIGLVLATGIAVCRAQSPVQAAGAPALAPLSTPSGLLQPSLDAVRQTLTGLRAERWKRGTIREEAMTNVGAVLQDLQQNLPPLLKEADAAPSDVASVLPLSQHVNAIYDVLLRIEEAARISAPADQAGALQVSLNELGKARHSLEDQMQQTAVAQQKQLKDLRATIRTQAGVKLPVVTVPVVLPCVAPAKRRVVRPKAKPSAAPATSQKPSATPSATAPKTGP